MIHTYRLQGCKIALDVNSGAVHLLDDVSFRILSRAEEWEALPEQIPEEFLLALSAYDSADTVREAYGELWALQESGTLFSGDEYAPFADRMEDAPVKAMCLHVAHDCNLRCEYCFAAQGDFGHGRKLMPVEVGERAIDFLLTNSGSRRNLELDFFGGEPLMNFEVVRRVVAYARSKEAEYGKNFRFTITTNGLLLDGEKSAFINREMSNVVLSIDGRREINDRLRVRRDGSGSYDSIVPKYLSFLQGRQDKEYYVRGTFTKHNLDFTNDVFHLAELGFDQISVEPVVSDSRLDYSIKPEDLGRVFEEYETLAARIAKSREEGDFFNFFHFMLDLDQGPCAIKRLRGCGCGNEYVAVTPEGDIYPCHQFVGSEEWKMGSVLDGTFDRQTKRKFARANVYTKEDCASCWAKFYCSGGCNANNAQYEGDILKPHSLSCEIEKKRLECAIVLQAKQLASENRSLNS